MGLRKDDQNSRAGHTLKGLIICGPGGRIRCAGSLPTSWLKKYFPKNRRAEELPRPVQQWLSGKSDALLPLRVEKNGDSLVITLGEGGLGGQNYLLLEETSGLSRLEATVREKLTQRETEVLSWVAQGNANWTIGKILNLSPATVRKHLQNIYSKLGVENRTAAALCALEILRSELEIGL